MKKLAIILTVALVGLVTPVRAQLPLSDAATASVITCGPGNDFYLAFGHSAIRITDTILGIDHVYNYGTFDFNTPHFYLKFAQGQLNYCLSRTHFGHFMATYDYEQRAVWEQRLNLTPQEVSNLYVALEWNYMPENRYYKYDFFRDNCATRVRDMVESTLGKKTIGIDDWEDHSYRHWVHSATKGGCLEWWVMGVDLLLGLPTDHTCNKSEAMFYPMAMMWQYNNAMINDEIPLATCNNELLADHREPLHRSFPPIVVFALLLALTAVLTVKGWWRPWMDRTLFIIAGVVGLFLCFMWFGTDHWCTKWNLNILWASPLLILIAIRLNKSPRWALWLQEGCFVAAAVWIVACGLSLAILPIILTLVLRVACLIPRKPQQRQQQR
ncbi:MAG: DUF4105 domain-containing protein [Bacteroidales bacterium]|nr:DUF4105 domain-containing protein [Bacteroidales bacterium]